MSNITIDSVCTKGPVYPMLVHFENGLPKEDFEITCTVLQDRNRNRHIATELAEVVYTGKEDNEDSCKTMILARNRKTGKTRLIEMGHVELKPMTKADLDYMEQQNDADLLKLRKNITKKTEKIAPQQKLEVNVVQKQLKNGNAGAHISLDPLESVCNEKDIESPISMQPKHEESLGLNRNIKSKHEQLVPPNRSKVDVIEEEMENKTAAGVNDTVDGDTSASNESGFEDYLPPINREATKLEDVYCVEKIITKDEQKKIYWELQEKDYEKDLHPYVLSLVKGKTLSVKETVLSVYASDLIKFKHLIKDQIRKRGIKLNHHSETLNQILINQLTKVMKHKNKSKKQGFGFMRCLTQQAKNRAMCGAIMSMLILNDFKLQIWPLCNVFNQCLKFIKTKACLLGASIVNDNGEEMVQLKLPLTKFSKEISNIDSDSLQWYESSTSVPSEKISSNKQEKKNDISVPVSRQSTKPDYDGNDFDNAPLIEADKVILDSWRVKNGTVDKSMEFGSKNKKNLKRQGKFKNDIQTVTEEMETIKDSVTDQLNISYDSNDSDDLYIFPVNRETARAKETLQQSNGYNKFQNVTGQIETVKDSVADYEPYIASYDEVDPDFYASLENRDTEELDLDNHESRRNRSKKHKEKTKQPSHVDDQNVTGDKENITDDKLDISYDASNDLDDWYILPQNRKSTVSNYYENDSNKSMVSKKRKRKMKLLEKFKVDDLTITEHMKSINGRGTVDDLDISYNMNDDDDESGLLETSKELDSMKHKKKKKQQDKLKNYVKTVKDTEQMKNVNANVTDDQLNLSANDENYLDDHKLLIHREATKKDSLQKGHESNRLEKSKKNESREHKRQTVLREKLNSDFQSIVQYSENANGYAEFDQIDVSACNNNYSDDESSLETSWKLFSKRKKIEHQENVKGNSRNFPEKEEGGNDSVTGDHLDISYDTNDSDDLYILPRNRKSSTVKELTSLQQSIEADDHLDISYDTNDSDDLYILPRNRKSSTVKETSLQQSIEGNKLEKRKVESRKEEKGDDFYLPPINREATEVENVYPLDKILSKDEYENIYLELQKNDYLADLHPYVQSFIKSKTLSLKANSTG